MMNSKKIEANKTLTKVLFVSPGYKPVPDIAGGAVEHLMTQLIEENERKHEFLFDLYTIADRRLSEFSFDSTRIHQVRNFRKTFFLRAFSLILNTVYSVLKIPRRFNYLGRRAAFGMDEDTSFILVENDVHVFMQINQLVPDKPILFHMHNDFDTMGEMQKTRVSMKYVLDNAMQIWTVSAYLKRHLCAEFPDADESKIKVLENCIDRARFSIMADSAEKIVAFRRKYDIESDDFVILFSGRILKQKGVVELLNAAVKFPSDMHYKIVIAGNVDSASCDYKKQIYDAAECLNKKVVFTGYIPQYEIQAAYAATDIVAIPSLCNEAFCLTALEAISSGKPCVASASGALEDVLNIHCAKLIELNADFISNFSKAIFELYTNKKMYMEMSKNARKRASEFADNKQYFLNFCLLAHAVMDSEIKL